MQEKATISLEEKNLLKKSAVEQFLSNIFVAKKKDGENRPVINLKKSNQYIRFLHFKMESLESLNTLFQKIESMCKIDFKDTDLSVSLSQDNQKKTIFRW